MHQHVPFAKQIIPHCSAVPQWYCSLQVGPQDLRKKFQCEAGVVVAVSYSQLFWEAVRESDGKFTVGSCHKSAAPDPAHSSAFSAT